MERIPSADWKIIVGATAHVVGPCCTVLQRAVHSVVISTQIDRLHDVDLAALRPCAIERLRWQHPNCWPKPLAEWKPRPCFDSAIFPIRKPTGIEATRRVRFADYGGIIFGTTDQTGRVVCQSYDV